MLWRVTTLPETRTDTLKTPHDGRFVLHRHRDALGRHLDLRLECGDVLLGWRMEGDPFHESRGWAQEKMPHPLCWLMQDGEALREDAGLYRWLRREDAEREIMLNGKTRDVVLRFTRAEGLSTSAVGTIHETLSRLRINPEDAARLIHDGMTARQHAIARLCGLGRELDGNSFDEHVWRKSLAALSLEEIHHQLRTFEVRFDQVYPAEPVSRPERLEKTSDEVTFQRGLDLLREHDA